MFRAIANFKLIIKIIILSAGISTITLLHGHKQAKNDPAQLTVIMVLDQCGHWQLERLKPFFKHGFKELFENGIVYEHAVHPHGIPSTSAGHNSLSTGTLPKDHGAVDNDWMDLRGNNILYGTDTRSSARLFVKHGNDYEASTTKGASCHHTIVDGLSDQFVSSSSKHTPRKSFSFSLKMRSAVATAHELGKAIWFDEDEGIFTSSKAYYHDNLPSWVQAFNKTHLISRTSCDWPLQFNENAPAYQFPFTHDYSHAETPVQLAGTKKLSVGLNSKHKYRLYCSSPQASRDVLQLALNCIEHVLDEQDRTQMLVWVCLSNIDTIGHKYGPDSLESIDLLYHIDQQLGSFMQAVRAIVGSENVLFALTADHGSESIPEISIKKGFSQARRIFTPTIVQEMNNLIEKKFNISNLVLPATASLFFLNQTIFRKLPLDQRKQILITLKDYLVALPGVKEAWTCHELATTYFEPYDIRQFYKNLLFKERCPDLICQPLPHVQFSRFATGTSHDTPYDYNTHVPLIIHQKGAFQRTHVHKRVWIPQLPVTIAHLLKLPQPSASSYEMLPLAICPQTP